MLSETLGAHQGLVKGEKFCFRNLYFYLDMERVLLQPDNSLLQPANKSKDLNKVLLLLQDLREHVPGMLED